VDGPREPDDEFLADYYEHVAVEDIQDYSLEVLEHRARAHLSLASVRAPGETKVTVVNEHEAAVVFVVADDLPHLVRSVTAELTRDDASIRLLIHPILMVARDAATHELLAVHRAARRSGLPVGPPTSGGHSGPEDGERAEAWIAAEIPRLPDEASAEKLRLRLERIIADVRAVAQDAGALRDRLASAVDTLDSLPSASTPPADQLAELLAWMDRGNFILLGACDYERTTTEGREILTRRPGSGLGLLRRHRPPEHDEVPGGSARVLSLVTSGLRSSVERPAYLDELRLTVFAPDGAIQGERRFVGLFALRAAGPSLRRVPVVREKVAAVQELLGFARGSHESTQLLAALESFPVDELFQIDVPELARLAGEILRAQERRQTRLFVRSDPRGRLVTALVLLPRNRYSTAARLRMEQELRHAFRPASLEFDVRLSEGLMARVFFRLLMPSEGTSPDVDGPTLEKSLVRATRTWAEGLDEALRAQLPASRAARLSPLWSDAFPASYRAELEPEDAVGDIRRFEEFDLDGTGGRPTGDPLLTVTGAEASSRTARIRLYLTSAPSLTRILPFFHNLGLEVQDQRPFEIRRANGGPLFLYDLGVTYPRGVDPGATSALLAEGFDASMRGDSESDRFDALMLQEGLEWREVSILRGYAKYLLQLGTTNSYDFIIDALVGNAQATHALLGLFRARFDPTVRPAERLRETGSARAAALEAIEAVASLDADRLLRTFLGLIEATTRTNFYRGRGFVSFKLQPSHLPWAPYPRPRSEVWVYSPRVEGVHLRFGPVARGGIRWSERREDFRTEVLGLAKAQIAKNSVIVPTGAKGGFYPKRLPDPEADRAVWLAEGTEAYRDFIRGLLDVTDNLALPEGRIVPPERVVRHDEDDTYLVVAADKGTAAFSDTANAVAAEYGYWLGDAFASGGSIGYDHKRLGITARGAWESAKAHFRQLGVDCQTQDFTAVGIGDMSGDVFGNGMLLSEHTRLVAAFDHRHIFLDPNPDPALSFKERRRLFDLPRSSWADYSPALISEGGGVHPRTAKSIPLTPQAREALGIPGTAAAMPPNELIQAILAAPVDLLYNGGIGTYVRATAETNAQVGDKANDPIRISAAQLRARIVVEGGNLGLTQRARVEAALGGVLLNTDAIDNSAGVDCSDHEVNIKIFLDRMIAAGKLDPSERAPLLHSLADDVAAHVLKNNRDQNTLLRNDQALVLNWSPGFERAMDWLEKAADLDRTLEALPTTAELHARLAAGHGLTAPELAVLAAYAKIELTRELAETDLADDPWFDRVLQDYFPHQIVQRFGPDLPTHPLRQQIICTVLANDIINLGGITFAFRVIEETTATPAAVARGFVVAREAYDLQRFVDRVAALPPEFPSEHAAELAVHMRRTLDRAARWYVTHDHRDQPLDQALARILPTLERLRTSTADYLLGEDTDRVQARLAYWDALGLPHDMARRAADILESFGLLDISLISERVDEPVERIADLYWAVFSRLRAAQLLLRITDLPREDRWEALARAALRDDVYSVVADITIAVMRTTGHAQDTLFADPADRIIEWERGHQEQLARIKDSLAEVTRPGPVSITSLSVVLKLLRTLVRT
jgi:glutamate dehydrogenase